MLIDRLVPVPLRRRAPRAREHSPKPDLMSVSAWLLPGLYSPTPPRRRQLARRVEHLVRRLGRQELGDARLVLLCWHLLCSGHDETEP